MSKITTPESILEDNKNKDKKERAKKKKDMLIDNNILKSMHERINSAETDEEAEKIRNKLEIVKQVMRNKK